MGNDAEVKEVSICGKVFLLSKEELHSLKNPTRLQSKKVQWTLSDMLDDDVERVLEEYKIDLDNAISNWDRLPVSH
jgi:hypothetical protein